MICALFTATELGSNHAGRYSRFAFLFMFRSLSTQKGQMNLYPFTERAFRIATTIIALLAPLGIVMANEPSPLDLVRWGLTRWWVMESPIWVTSKEQCDAFGKEFADELARLNKLHDECLLEADPSEPSGNAGCSKAYCQPLHTARNQANEKSAGQVRLCLDRLNDFLSKQDVKPQSSAKPGIPQG